ncbi:hypothetical protein LTR36_004784 [Oleoguttula mirabilis]|uniref:Uncharacterized protein n=1 Tax=Oleoguttula mirabilis TaxID=1507867 RepID=A0AAV9JGV8_9PEZI|nr:hypothetical protein LTR36_004784 [Oleoguttula mirabilis]
MANPTAAYPPMVDTTPVTAAHFNVAMQIVYAYIRKRHDNITASTRSFQQQGISTQMELMNLRRDLAELIFQLQRRLEHLEAGMEALSGRTARPRDDGLVGHFGQDGEGVKDEGVKDEGVKDEGVKDEGVKDESGEKKVKKEPFEQ